MMNVLARDFFSEGPLFSSVRVLSDEKELSWDSLGELSADLPRSWFELSRLPREDRVYFTADFWMSRFSFQPEAHSLLHDFFQRLDDVAVILVQEKESGKWRSEMVYSLESSRSFFRGLPPASDQDLLEFQQEVRALLPRDYLSFLKIHDGFGKLSDLGVLPIDQVVQHRRSLFQWMLESDPPLSEERERVDPGALIPFFEQEGLSSFQCFYADWYPGSEMGNVFFSGMDGTISPPGERESGEGSSFPSFLQWLVHYLQGMATFL